MRITTFLAFTLFFSISSYSQPGFDTKKQFYFFKTWNWLKYYHPDLAAGKVLADSLFLYYFPAIDQARSRWRRKTLNLPGNYGLQFTGNAIFYPDGTSAQRKGVKINLPLCPSVKELLSGQDMLLNKALELINKR